VVVVPERCSELHPEYVCLPFCQLRILDNARIIEPRFLFERTRGCLTCRCVGLSTMNRRTPVRAPSPMSARTSPRAPTSPKYPGHSKDYSFSLSSSLSHGTTSFSSLGGKSSVSLSSKSLSLSSAKSVSQGRPAVSVSPPSSPPLRVKKQTRKEMNAMCAFAGLEQSRTAYPGMGHSPHPSGRFSPLSRVCFMSCSLYQCVICC